MNGDFGSRVRVARRARGMNQSELARAVGCHQTAIAKIEHGRQQVSLKGAVDLSVALDVELSDLIADDPIRIPARKMAADVEVRLRRAIADAEQLLADLRGLLS